jgi:hypothetical protein
MWQDMLTQPNPVNETLHTVATLHTLAVLSIQDLEPYTIIYPRCNVSLEGAQRIIENAAHYYLPDRLQRHEQVLGYLQSYRCVMLQCARWFDHPSVRQPLFKFLSAYLRHFVNTSHHIVKQHLPDLEVQTTLRCVSMQPFAEAPYLVTGLYASSQGVLRTMNFRARDLLQSHSFAGARTDFNRFSACTVPKFMAYVEETWGNKTDTYTKYADDSEEVMAMQEENRRRRRERAGLDPDESSDEENEDHIVMDQQIDKDRNPEKTFNPFELFGKLVDDSSPVDNSCREALEMLTYEGFAPELPRKLFQFSWLCQRLYHRFRHIFPELRLQPFPMPLRPHSTLTWGDANSDIFDQHTLRTLATYMVDKWHTRWLQWSAKQQDQSFTFAGLGQHPRVGRDSAIYRAMKSDIWHAELMLQQPKVLRQPEVLLQIMQLADMQSSIKDHNLTTKRITGHRRTASDIFASMFVEDDTQHASKRLKSADKK